MQIDENYHMKHFMHPHDHESQSLQLILIVEIKFQEMEMYVETETKFGLRIDKEKVLMHIMHVCRLA